MPVVGLGPLLSLNGGPRSKRLLVAHVVHGARRRRGGRALRRARGRGEGARSVPEGDALLTGAAALEDGRVALPSTRRHRAAAPLPVASPRAAGATGGCGSCVDDSAIARAEAELLLSSLGTR
jgi:two-component system chemotaxis sensor kinase CheA/two-component system sensor histidine kinase and response regulator WspE